MRTAVRGTPSARSRRSRLCLLALCAALLVAQPVAGASQADDAGDAVAVAQLGSAVREPICQLVRSLQTAFGDFPDVAGVFTSLLQSFGCSGPSTPGTTTTTTFVTTTTTTLVPGTTTSTVGTGTTTPTTPTTLPPCIPDNPVTTTVPCVPITTTTSAT